MTTNAARTALTNGPLGKFASSIVSEIFAMLSEDVMNFVS